MLHHLHRTGKITDIHETVSIVSEHVVAAVQPRYS
jgi:hypothetical protein